MQNEGHHKIMNGCVEDSDAVPDSYNSLELYNACVEPLEDMLPSIRCLVFGGSAGWIAVNNASETGRSWTVLDTSPVMAKHDFSPANFVMANPHSLPFNDGEFGHVVISSTLERTDIATVLKEVHRILSPRGHLVLAHIVTEVPSEELAWHEELHVLRYPDSSHFQISENLTDIVKTAGFRLIATRYLKERCNDDLEVWVSKNGTIEGEKVDQIRRLIMNPPPLTRQSTNQVIEDGKLMYDQTWMVCYARKETTKAPLTPAVLSMIVEREIEGEKSILLQKRKKRYEEPTHYNCWELPQGKLEKGASVTDTISHELEDETGLKLLAVSELNPVRTTNDPQYNDQTEMMSPLICVRVSGGIDFMAVAIIISAIGEPCSLDINREHQWFPVKDLRRVLQHESVYPLNRPMLEAYVSIIDPLI